MSRAEELQQKIAGGMNLLFDNIDDDIALYTYVYIRDKSDRTENEDGEMAIRTMSKNMMMYDAYTVKQNVQANIDVDSAAE